MMKRTKVVLVAGTAALALAGIGGGVAFAAGGDTPSATPAPASTQTTATTTHPRRAAAVLRHLEHGEITVGTKQGDRVVDVQRGQVTSVSATSVTVRSGDGFTATYAVDSTSKIRVQRQASTISSVHDGDHVTVVALRANGKATIRRLADPK